MICGACCACGAAWCGEACVVWCGDVGGVRGLSNFSSVSQFLLCIVVVAAAVVLFLLRCWVVVVDMLVVVLVLLVCVCVWGVVVSQTHHLVAVS